MTESAYEPYRSPIALSSRGASTALVFGLLPIPLVVFVYGGGPYQLAHAMYPSATGFEGLGPMIVVALIAGVTCVVGALVSLIVGIVALVRIADGRARGRIRAIVGTALGAVWVLVAVGGIVRGALGL